MKKTLLCISISVLWSSLLTLNAQDIPNYSFENWTMIGSYLEPDEWESNNELFLTMYDYHTVKKDSANPYTGSYCMRMESETHFIISEDVTLPALITLGQYNVDIMTQTISVTGGIPFPYRPSALKGYYRYYPNGTDSCGIGVGLSKYSAGNRDTLASSDTLLPAASSWTHFEIPISYKNGETPDSMNIIIVSSNPDNLKDSSVLYIDSLYFDYSPTNISEKKDNKESYNIFPNPADKELNVHIRLPEYRAIDIRFYNLIGKEIYHSKSIYAKSIQKRYNIASLKSGIYFITINAGEDSFTKKISVH